MSNNIKGKKIDELYHKYITSGDVSIAIEIIKSYFPIMAKSTNCSDEGELLSVGWIVFSKIINNFDDRVGTFSTYAYSIFFNMSKRLQKFHKQNSADLMFKFEDRVDCEEGMDYVSNGSVIDPLSGGQHINASRIYDIMEDLDIFDRYTSEDVDKESIIRDTARKLSVKYNIAEEFLYLKIEGYTIEEISDILDVSYTKVAFVSRQLKSFLSDRE